MKNFKSFFLFQLETSTEGIHERLKLIDDYQTHHRLREATGRKRAEDLNERVMYWSVGQAGIILFIGILQVMFYIIFLNTFYSIFLYVFCIFLIRVMVYFDSKSFQNNLNSEFEKLKLKCPDQINQSINQILITR